MQLIDEIIRDLVDENAGLSNILRKAKILASELNVPEFKEWLVFELEGYPSEDSVPEYRISDALNFGDFTGPFNSGVKNQILPTMGLPEPIKSYAERIIFLDNVATLQEMLVDRPGGYYDVWPEEMVFLARPHIQMSAGMVFSGARKRISPHLVSGTLDSVRNRLMDFVLDLRENDVSSESLRNGTLKREIVLNSFNSYVYGNQNNVATGVNVHQQITPVEQGDIESLLNALRELNLADEDLRELHTAVASEPTAEKDGFGSKVNAWIVKTVGKAASGALRFGADQTTAAIMQALNGYYGNLA